MSPPFEVFEPLESPPELPPDGPREPILTLPGALTAYVLLLAVVHVVRLLLPFDTDDVVIQIFGFIPKRYDSTLLAIASTRAVADAAAAISATANAAFEAMPHQALRSAMNSASRPIAAMISGGTCSQPLFRHHEVSTKNATWCRRAATCAARSASPRMAPTSKGC